VGYHPRSVAERDSVPFAVSHRRVAGLRGTNGGEGPACLLRGTRWWVGVDKAHYTENAQVQNKPHLAGESHRPGARFVRLPPHFVSRQRNFLKNVWRELIFNVIGDELIKIILRVARFSNLKGFSANGIFE
jgi:hypothetical protein